MAHFVSRQEDPDRYITLRVRCLDDFYEGQMATFQYQLEGKPMKEVKRRVRYNSMDGTYVVIENYKIFAYDFYNTDEDGWIEIEIIAR